VLETADPRRIIRKGWKQSHRFAVEKDEDGGESRWLVVLERGQIGSEDGRALAPREQTLAHHQHAVAEKVRRSAEATALTDAHTKALTIAARMHDEGKNVWRWQRAFNAPRDGRAYAKAGGPLNIRLLDGYRHEFGSLWKIRNDPEFQQLDTVLQDLVLHIVAAHHGSARPVISTRSCEEGGPDEMARDVALRFARLQKHWGPWGLAWWEALLRAADQQASRENDGEDRAEAVATEGAVKEAV
jgi:CRISPR-associated endonuclease/helicase Cas3